VTFKLCWNSLLNRRKVMLVKKNPIVALLILVAGVLASAQDVTPRRGGVAGVVRFPGGSPSPDATVLAVTNCKSDVHVSSVQEVKTSSDGSFYVPPFFASGCNHVLLSASKVEDFWLKTGREVFYEAENGTTLEVDAPWTGPPSTAEIKLDRQGGLVSFRVWDVASHQFIWAELRIKRPVPGSQFDSVQIATGRDGSAFTRLLPAGQYEILVEQYSCHGTDYFSASPPRENLTVKLGQKTAKEISVDVRTIAPKSSYNNPTAKPCDP
jgi:hypothetical protein